MSSTVRIELNTDAVREELLKSQWMADTCQEIANNIASTAGEGYAVSTYQGKNRVNCSVYAETKEAYRDNLKNNTLLKAIGSVQQ